MLHHLQSVTTRSKTRAQIAPAVFHADDWSSLSSSVETIETALTLEQANADAMRYTDGLKESRHDAIERDLLFEFQARSPDPQDLQLK